MENNKKRSIVIKRALVILVLFLLVLTGLFSRFVYIQAAKEVQGHDLKELLERRWAQSRVLDGKRGSIFDRNGETLAEELTSYTVVAILDERYQDRVEDPEHTAQQLSTVLDIEVNNLIEFLSQEGRVQVELGPKAKNLSYEKMKEIEELKLPGIQFRQDPRRYYPKQTFASHIIGYTERDMSVARMGLESSLNEYLKDEQGRISYQKDGKNRRLVNANEIIDPPKNGDNVYLTLDTRIQMAIEQTMNQVIEEYNPERVMAIVANAKTGEILGMSNRPSFNPNQYESIVNYTNYNISARFEPGSTMKIYPLAAAIEEGLYDGEELYQSGSYQIGPDRIHDHNRGGWGKISFNEGFQRSSNVAYSIIALEKLGPDKLYEYLDAFGFYSPTGIDLPNEINGTIARNQRIDAATTAYGQASAVTPIQQIQAATAIANGGKMMKPYIIDRIESTEGETILKNEPVIVGEPISSNTSKEVLELLESVVTSEVGTGRPYAIDGYRVAGKTGTAQIPRDDGPGYLTGHGNFVYSFMGMAPAEDPEVIVYVAVDRPEIEETEPGSAPVSLIFKSVMNQSLQYLNISPTESTDQKEEVNTMLDVTGTNVSNAMEQLESMGYDVVVLGNGNKVTQQHPLGNQKLIPGEKVYLKTDGTSITMPNLEGWSTRQVYGLANMLDVSANLVGRGYVYSQSPEPGVELKGKERIIVNLRSPGDFVEGEQQLDESFVEGEEEEEGFFMD